MQLLQPGFPINILNLDIITWTIYPVRGTVNQGPLGFRMGDPAEMSFRHDFLRSINGFQGLMELQPGLGTKVIASYGDHLFAGKPDATTRTLGRGTVTYIGVDSLEGQLEFILLGKIFDQARVGVEKYVVSQSINPSAFGGAFLAYCVKEGWLSKSGKGQFTKNYPTKRAVIN